MHAITFFIMFRECMNILFIIKWRLYELMVNDHIPPPQFMLTIAFWMKNKFQACSIVSFVHTHTHTHILWMFLDLYPTINHSNTCVHLRINPKARLPYICIWMGHPLLLFTSTRGQGAISIEELNLQWEWHLLTINRCWTFNQLPLEFGKHETTQIISQLYLQRTIFI